MTSDGRLLLFPVLLLEDSGDEACEATLEVVAFDPENEFK